MTVKGNSVGVAGSWLGREEDLKEVRADAFVWGNAESFYFTIYLSIIFSFLCFNGRQVSLYSLSDNPKHATTVVDAKSLLT